MKKLIPYLMVVTICSVSVCHAALAEAANKALHDHLDRIEKKIDDLGKKINSCDCKAMMKKMKPMHEKMKQKREKMMVGMKGDMQKQKEQKLPEAEEHKQHHPETVGK